MRTTTMAEPIFKQSPWRKTASNTVTSLFLYYNGLIHSTQIRIPSDKDTPLMRDDCIKYAQDKLWEELYKNKKGFEPISKKKAIDGTEYFDDPLLKTGDDKIQLG